MTGLGEAMQSSVRRNLSDDAAPKLEQLLVNQRLALATSPLAPQHEGHEGGELSCRSACPPLRLPPPGRLAATAADRSAALAIKRRAERGAGRVALQRELPACRPEPSEPNGTARNEELSWCVLEDETRVAQVAA